MMGVWFMFCTNCGKEIINDNVFCTNCGTPVASLGASEQKESSQDANTQSQTTYVPEKDTTFTSLISPRSIVICIILSMVSFGFYSIYWFISMVNELNVVSNMPKEQSGGVVFLLTLLTCGIYGFVWMYKSGEQLCKAKKIATGENASDNGVLYLVLSLFGWGFIVYCLIQYELNRLARL